MYKTVPELFLGVLLITLIFGEWVYVSFKRQNQELEKKKGEKGTGENYDNTFKNISPRKRFVKYETREVLNSEDEIE